MKGRKPIPTALKKLKGTDQPCRINKNEVNPNLVTKLPSCPTWFSKTAKKIYRTKGAQLIAQKILTVADIDLFLSYCREYGNYIETSIELDKIPLNAALSEKSEPVYKRLQKINTESWNRAKSIAIEFGFTPSSRSRVGSVQEKEKDLFSELFG